MARKPKIQAGQLGFFGFDIPEIPELFDNSSVVKASEVKQVAAEESVQIENDNVYEVVNDGSQVQKKKPPVVKYTGKVSVDKVLNFGKPVVFLHKNGPYLLFKGGDPIAAELLHEAISRISQCSLMRFPNFWYVPNQDGEYEKPQWNHISDWRKIELWKHLHGNVLDHPLCHILKELEVEVCAVPTLANYIKKEAKRQDLEDTPYPAPELHGEASLFERAGVGTVLRCIKDYITHSEDDGTVTWFSKGNRYMVVANEEDGIDSIRISTKAVNDGVTLSTEKQYSTIQWTNFHPPMEQFFDDSESVDLGPTIDVKYEDLVNRMKKRLEDMGISLFDHQKIDAAMIALKRGSVDGKLMRMGKAQPLDSKVLTPTGWKPMGNLTIGSEVIGANGQSHKVTGVFPQGKKTVYRVTFSDGSSTECCKEHLWQVHTAEWKYSGRGSKVMSLEQLMKKGLKFSNGNNRYYIPMVKPIQFPEESLSLDPYLLGVLLGDGSLSQGSIRFTSADLEIVSEIRSLLPEGVNVISAGGYDYRLSIGQKGGKGNPVKNALGGLGLLCKSDGKFIPEAYKFSSEHQRRRLLAGLLDTDGSIWKQLKPNAAPVIEYTSISERLIDDVQFLVESLGGRAVKSVRVTQYSHKGELLDGQPAFRLRISLPGDHNPFFLSRKRDRYSRRMKFQPTRAMVSIEEVGLKECQCISVDAEDHLYVTDHCIVTHNTATAVAVVSLWGSNKIAVFGSRNALVDGWQKEFKRLGITDYILVDNIRDLEKPAKYYLIRYGFIRRLTDPSKSERREKTNYLRPAEYTIRYPGEKIGKWIIAKASWLVHHPCPHCKNPLYRPLFTKDSTGKIYKVKWSPANGYMCRNTKCLWQSDNRKNYGAAWCTGQIVIHQGGFVDFGLAAHANCNPESVVGRKCEECGETDSVWIPQITRRIKKDFNGVVVDEIHNCKDPGSLQAKALFRMRARRRHGMTGTPVSNSVLDTYYVLRWLMGKQRRSFPYVYDDGVKRFELEFCQHAYLQKPTGEIDETTGEKITKTVRRRLPYLKNPGEWWKFSAPKILRRNTTDPLYQKSLKDAGMISPTCVIKTVTCPMLPEQAKLMLAALKSFEGFYSDAVKQADSLGEDLSKMLVISQMTAMSIIATCPDWMNQRLGKQVYNGPPGGGKMYNISTIAKTKIKQGGKVVILSDYRVMQKNIAEDLKEFNPILFNSTWGDSERFEAFLEFREDPNRQVFIAGTRAISEGVDLSSADTVICADLLWSPAFQVQAWSRILAPSPTVRDCEVYLLQSANSIDEHKYNTFYAKMVASDQALDRKVVNRRTMEFNIKWFAERIIEEEANLALQLRDMGIDEENFIMPDDEYSFEERSA